MSELKILKEQIADDFQMTWKILGETADRLDRRIDRIVLDLQKLGGEMSEGLRQAQGRMRLLEERFGTFVGVLEQEASRAHERLDDHEERLRRLEDPAA
ncbi:MAG: hypothetical protein AMXMBFR33_06660 [Candidatus Xenobia bacterium]